MRLENKKILVTGDAGLIGSHLIDLYSCAFETKEINTI